MTPAILDWWRLLSAFPRLYLAAWCIRLACRLVRARRERWGAETLVKIGVAVWPDVPPRP